MNETTKKALRKALGFTYWTVDKWLCYLIQVGPTSTDKYYFQNGLAVSDISEGDLDNYARQTDKHNEEMDFKTALRYEELKAHWCDTDHIIKPRNESTNPSVTEAEFPVQYCIAWAMSRKIEIYWLEWAMEEKLVPGPAESTHVETLPYSVDWTKWGKIRRIELKNACGLLAGIDKPAYMYMRNKYDEWISGESKNDELGIRACFVADNRRDMEAAADRITLMESIDSVVTNHIESGCFIDTELVEVSRETAECSTRHGNIPENATSFYHVYVQLQEFGSWAKASGYQLPPGFPTTGDVKSVKSVGASKGGRAKAAITQGAREACRAEAKLMRQGKAHGDKPNLEDCATLLYGSREEIEARYNVNLPQARSTIREYLKTAEGEAEI